jgi:membrane glycosyltransferase
VLTDEGASFEENPPTLIEFARRDLRWCQGNMQYVHLVSLPGLRPVSRYQLGFAILMFLGSPAWVGLLLLGTLGVAVAGSGAAFIRSDAAYALLGIEFILWYAPTIATALDVLMQRKLLSAFGGTLRFLVSTLANMMFFQLLMPIMWIAHTIFLVRLLSGRSIGWGGQLRDDHEVRASLAIRVLWPQTLVGLLCVAVLALTVPAALPAALLLAGGPLIAITFAVITASPAVGRALLRLGVGRLPEELDPPPEMRALDLPAIVLAARLRGR